MSDVLPTLTFLRDDDQKRLIQVAGVAQPVSTPSELLAAVPALATPAGLGRYCDAVNYFARDEQFRVIHAPDAFRAKYQRRLESEDFNEPWQEGKVRLNDFGIARIEEVQSPRIDGLSLVFYAEHDYLGIPYRVTAPAPGQPDADPTYDVVTMDPVPT